MIPSESKSHVGRELQRASATQIGGIVTDAERWLRTRFGGIVRWQIGNIVTDAERWRRTRFGGIENVGIVPKVRWHRGKADWWRRAMADL